MTDNEIIKALECDTHTKCEECPYFREECSHFDLVRAEHILDLINRQKAEIELLHTVIKNEQDATRMWHGQAELNAEKIIRLQAENERLQDLLKGWKTEAYKVAEEKDKLYCEAVERVKTTKAEAIKAFAEMLKTQLSSLEWKADATRKTLPTNFVNEQIDWILKDVSIKIIDNLVKEMVGESDA